MIGYFYEITVTPTLGVSAPETPTLIRRSRIFSLPYDRAYAIYVSRIEFILHQGLGPLTGQGSDPNLQVRFSGDGGDTWHPWIEIPVGQTGRFEWRAVLNRVGKLRNGVCELAMSDPIPWYLVACFVDIDAEGR